MEFSYEIIAKSVSILTPKQHLTAVATNQKITRMRCLIDADNTCTYSEFWLLISDLMAIYKSS
jgi:hypothetical protein